MQSELKPCAHCGGEARLWSVIMPFDADCDSITVQCADCDAIGADVLVDQDVHSQSDLAALEVEAIAAWNARASDAEITRLTEALRDAEERVKGLREALEEISDLPGEINPCNYDHDDACELNRQFCYGLLIARQALAGGSDAE